MTTPPDPSPRCPHPGSTSFSVLAWLNRRALAQRFPAWQPEADPVEPLGGGAGEPLGGGASEPLGLEASEPLGRRAGEPLGRRAGEAPGEPGPARGLLEPRSPSERHASGEALSFTASGHRALPVSRCLPTRRYSPAYTDDFSTPT